MSLTPFTGTMHLVFSLVYSPSLRPIPAAKMIACIVVLCFYLSIIDCFSVIDQFNCKITILMLHSLLFSRKTAFLLPAALQTADLPPF
jgi:hypothetical protein